MKKEFFACLIALVSLVTNVYCQTSESINRLKYDEELAARLAKSPSFITYINVTDKITGEYVKEEFKKSPNGRVRTGGAGMLPSPLQFIIDDKTLTDKEKSDSLKKMGYTSMQDVRLIQQLEGANTTLINQFPELATLSKESLRTAFLKAFRLNHPVNNSSGADDYNKIFTKTEQPPMFPGGADSWKQYVERNLNKNTPALDGAPAGIYIVKIQFIIDTKGNITNVQSIEVPKECPSCGPEAKKLIMRGPRWQPAVQNGRNVVFQNVETISFSAGVQ